MNRVIRDFSRLSKDQQSILLEGYAEGGLERTSFPYKGSLCDGLILKEDEVIYLVPIRSIQEHSQQEEELDEELNSKDDDMGLMDDDIESDDDSDDDMD
ncbi:MAG: hypothetical protein EP338_14230 [Bacteroidetes bacterium]|nr:MAG: hypothetical protein EP338_14230 [Bacteroidota bacterium]